MITEEVPNGGGGGGADNPETIPMLGGANGGDGDTTEIKHPGAAPLASFVNETAVTPEDETKGGSGAKSQVQFQPPREILKQDVKDTKV